MIINNLDEFIYEFRNLLEQDLELTDILENGRAMLSELVLKPDWFHTILSKLFSNDDFVKSQLYNIDSNEIQIYRDPNNLFSIRAYIWEPNVIYPIHDHGSWGIIGTHINEIKERKFKIAENNDEKNVTIKQISETNHVKGDTSYVLPIDGGIHQMQAINNTAVTIHVYGSPVRKGYIRHFNASANTAKNIYSPVISKKIFAINVLGSINESWSEDILNSAINSSKYEFIKEECKNSLIKMNNETVKNSNIK